MSLVVGSAFIKVQKISDGSGSKIFHPGRVSHLWFGFEFQKFPLKMSNFSTFSPSGQKNCFRSGQKVPGSKPGRPLIYCGSKVSSGQGPSLKKYTST